jgi:Ser/Thr protein kinase RdoA (MazF antagonist)
VRLEALSRPRQLDVLRGVAHEALPHFGLRAQRLRLLRFIRNAVFRVEVGRGRWLVLRIYRPEHQDPRRANLEAAFLQQLAVHSSVRAPRPVPTCAGRSLLEFDSRALGGPAFAVVLRPVLGRRPPIECPSALTVERSGAVLAELHDQGRSLRLARRFRLPHADWGPFIQRGLRLPRLVQSHLGALACTELHRRIDRAHGFLAGAPGAQVGVLHGDFHQGNYLLRRGAVGPIDFSDCAVGPLVCDVATASTALVGRVGYAEKRAALLRGYRTRRDFPASHEAILDALIAVRVGISLAHVLGRPDHPYLEPSNLRTYLALTRNRLRGVGVAL